MLYTLNCEQMQGKQSEMAAFFVSQKSLSLSTQTEAS